MSSHSLEHSTPSADDSEELVVSDAVENEASKLPPLSGQAQADLWRYIDHLEHWRQSIGFEIHDGLTQQITAALLFLESYESEKPDKTSLERCRAILEEALAESRRLIQGLNPKKLDEEGMEAALRDFLSLPSLSMASVELDIADELPGLAPWQRSSLFRFVQESITNARKHSEATEIRVSLHPHGNRLVAKVQDNGVGFDLESIEFTGHGLQGLKQKAELLEAELSIRSTPGEGTTLELSVPTKPTNIKKP